MYTYIHIIIIHGYYRDVNTNRVKAEGEHGRTYAPTHTHTHTL